jgi:hypothetical protein
MVTATGTLARPNRVDVKSTSKYPREEVEFLIRFAHGGRETGPVAVNVKNSQHAYRGRAYSYMPDASNRTRSKTRGRYLVVVAIGTPDKFPKLGCRYPGLKTAPVYDLMTWQEAMVQVAAHEFTHCLQFRQGLRRSEIDAEERSLLCLQRYRAWRDSQPQVSDQLAV